MGDFMNFMMYPFGSSSKPSAPAAPPAMPSAPKPQASIDKAQMDVKRRRTNLSQTIYSSPLGVGSQGQAQIARKSLTGQ